MADVGDTVDGYKLRAILHPARKTTVFEVVEGSGRHFAMKMLLPELKEDKEAQQELYNDAEVGLKMRHENVINILKVSRSFKTYPPFFIMEYFPAGSLRNRLQSRQPSDKLFLKERAKPIFKQAATGLAYMTASGFIHKDIKPDNILCNAAGKVKIIDFAIAQPIKEQLPGRAVRRQQEDQVGPGDVQLHVPRADSEPQAGRPQRRVRLRLHAV